MFQRVNLLVESFAFKSICTCDLLDGLGVVEEFVGQAFFQVVDASQMRGFFLFVQRFFLIKLIFYNQILLLNCFVGLFERVALCLQKGLFLLEPHL